MLPVVRVYRQSLDDEGIAGRVESVRNRKAEAGGFALLPASVEAAGLEGENAQFLLTQGA